MGTERIDVEALARAAVGRALFTLDRGQPNEVLAVSDGAVIVRTNQTSSRDGSPVSLATIQEAADRLVREGELRIDPQTLGHRRTSFVGALLASSPRVVALTKPMRLRLRFNTTLQDHIEHALDLIPRPRETPAAERGEPLYGLFADSLRDDVATLVADEATYKTHGSAGRGNWAETPWVGVFDLSVTDSATRGHYLVYLFHRDGTRVYLSLNQGTTAIHKAEPRHYIQALEAKAREYSALLGIESGRDLLVGPIDLGGGRPPLTPGYEVGNVAAIAYDRGAVPDDARLAADLQRMLGFYSQLTERIDSVEAGEDHRPASDPVEFEEERRMRLHLRFEGRSRGAALLAKRAKGYRCEGCDVDYVALYGEAGKRCIDAHHRVPFAELGEGRRRLNPLRDFEIVCANCHRLIHSRRSEPLSIGELRTLLGRGSRSGRGSP